MDTGLSLIEGGVLTFVFAGLIWKIMVPPGARLAALLNEDSNTISAYSINIFGSLVGIWLFSLLSYFSFPPVIWFVVLVLLSIPLVASNNNFHKRGFIFLALIIVFPLIGGYLEPAKEIRWSPYQKLEIFPQPNNPTEFEVAVNNSGYQQIQNNSIAYVRQNSSELLDEHGVMSQYDIPGRLAPHSKDILIVGAGTGNDVAGALRTTTGEITAVEIDPVILNFGKKYHPESPYDSPRIHFIVDDARATFMRTDKKYDLIVFGLLDSHSTPALTNARLDHYVYTIESISQAAKLLTPEGIMVVIFQPQRPYVYMRLAQTLQAVFGKLPMTLSVPNSEVGWGGEVFISGNEQSIAKGLSNDLHLNEYVKTHALTEKTLLAKKVRPTTDDWPYLYLERPTVPLLFVFLGIMLVGLWMQSRKVLGTMPLTKLFDRESLPFLAMGAGFSLFEVYGVNQAAILFGSSWIVNSIVISSILSMILLANVFQQKTNLFSYRRHIFLLLIITLGGIYALNLSHFISWSPIAKGLFAVSIFGGPMFLSGVNFAALFETASNKGKALGANLFGALLGGVLQLATFPFGIKSLLIFASAAYLLAWSAVKGVRRES